MFVIMLVQIASDALLYREEVPSLEAAKSVASALAAPYVPSYEENNSVQMNEDEFELTFKFSGLELVIVEL